MKTRTIISFVVWLLKKQFDGIVQLYQKYDDYVVKNPGIAVMPTLLVMMLSALIFMLVFAIIGHYLLFPFFWMAFAILVVFNYFKIILREQFKKFQKERQKLFNVIKDGK